MGIDLSDLTVHVQSFFNALQVETALAALGFFYCVTNA